MSGAYNDKLRLGDGAWLRLLDGSPVAVEIELNKAHVIERSGMTLEPGVVRGVPGVDMITNPPTFVISIEAFWRIAAAIEE